MKHVKSFTLVVPKEGIHGKIAFIWTITININLFMLMDTRL